MKLNNQRRIAAYILKVGTNRVWLDPTKASDIKEAITKADIKSLINNHVIKAIPEKGISRFRIRKRIRQRRKGRLSGSGSRKGKKTARLPSKKIWINMMRSQREFLKMIRDKKLITPNTYHELYKRSKGGFFRSVRHIKLYLNEHNLIKK